MQQSCTPGSVGALGGQHPRATRVDLHSQTIPYTRTGNAFTNGVTGIGNTSGDVTFVVPSDAPNTLFYDCAVHLAMGGTINIVN